MSTFKVGQKVVAVSHPSGSGDYGGWYFPLGHINTGDVYTVKNWGCVDGQHYVAVWESPVVWALSGVEYGWDSLNFRPLLDSALEEQVDELEEQTVEA